MRRLIYAWLVLRSLYELVRYDCLLRLRGFGCIRRQLSNLAVAETVTAQDRERSVCDAVLLATCLYWKPVLCLQRSVCVVRLLRAHGIAGRLVVGYRPTPFLSHAWAEVDGRVVNSSPVYRERLQLLYTA